MSIKAIRLERGITQRQLCKDTRLKPVSYGAMENNKIPVDYETLQVLSAYYGIPIKDLI